MKKYSVWVRFEGIHGRTLKDAEKKVSEFIKVNGQQIIKGVLLKKLNRDFYPTEK